MNRMPLGAIAALAASEALSQTVTISAGHDDPDGIVTPGQTVHITHTLTMTAFMVSDWRGDAGVAPNLGVASNVYSDFLGPPYASIGGVLGGSVVGVSASFPAPLFVPFVPPPWASPQSTLLAYDWTAPTTPGVYEFRWAPHPSSPQVSGYLSSTSIMLVPFPTNYLGTSLTVIPAPSTTLLAAATIALATRRSRR